MCAKQSMRNTSVAGDPSAVSAFARRVYDVVARIPEGRVSTYAAIAARIGCRSPRAVGGALRRNPFAPKVPCHRVIASDLRLGGFQGDLAGAAVERKRRLLAGEGVKFIKDRLAEPSRLWP